MGCGGLATFEATEGGSGEVGVVGAAVELRSPAPVHWHKPAAVCELRGFLQAQSV